MEALVGFDFALACKGSTSTSKALALAQGTRLFLRFMYRPFLKSKTKAKLVIDKTGIVLQRCVATRRRYP
jgi:hypothetical protein